MSLESEIKEFGKKAFELIGEEQPATFNKRALSGKLMQWSMSEPEFKVNLFRLVDVLPALKSGSAIAKHIHEYLKDSAGQLSPILKFGVQAATLPGIDQIAALTVKQSVNEMAKLFIAGADAKSALRALKGIRKRGLAFTVDLLGEYSVSEKEALEYLERYLDALEILGKKVPTWKESKCLIENHPGDASAVCISVKLSALYSQCSVLNFDRSVKVLTERLTIIADRAKQYNARLYVDAEDSATNPLIIAAFKQVFSNAAFSDFPYPGIVLQAYNKSAEHTLNDLLQFANNRNAPIAVRLVKGAYWDHEVIGARYNGWEPPLFEKKSASDAHFEKLSRLLLDNHQICLPAFGSHNVRSLAHACCYAQKKHVPITAFELQMLYGMAEPIAQAFRRMNYLVRLYVPLGEMLPGMGYLVRRLLENTSNESFLRHTFVNENEVEKLLEAPSY